MARASRCETYSKSMEQSKVSLSSLCTAVLSKQLPPACLCSAHEQCPRTSGGTATGNPRIAAASAHQQLMQAAEVPPHKKRRHVDDSRPPVLDMDGDMQLEEQHDVQ